MADRDVLGWLLPEAPAEQAQHAQRVVTFLRLLRDDARGQGAETVGVDLARGRQELARETHRRRVSALADLLRYYLQAALPQDSFLSLGQPRASFQRAWERLDGLPVPLPEEESLEVAARLLRWAEGLPAESRWLGVWRARLAHARLGFAGAKPGWQRLALRARREKDAPLEAVALLGLVQGCLGQWDPRAADRLLRRHAGLLERSFELRRCRLWVSLLLGRVEAARRMCVGFDLSGALLPAPLASLRQRMPCWEGLLAGVARCAGPRSSSVGDLGRRAFGAWALGVLRFDPAQGRLHAVAWELPSSRRQALEGWSERRRGAWTRAGEPEHRALVLRQIHRWHACDGEVNAACLHAKSLALALVPILDAGGQPLGWIHLEYGHHLLPSGPCLEALAKSWAKRLLNGCKLRSAAPVSGLAQVALRREAQRALECMPLVLGSRQASFLVRRSEGSLRRLASLGADGQLEDHVSGLAAQRVLRLATPFAFVRGEGLGTFVGARSGVLAPVVIRGRAEAVLCLESKRLGHFSRQDLERLASFAAQQAEAWRSARFNAWHRMRFGTWAASPLGSRWWREQDGEGWTFALQPLLLHGPAHTGKLHLARWIHHEGRGPRRPFVGLVGAQASGESLARGWMQAQGGTLCLRQLDALGAQEQRELVRCLVAQTDVREVDRVRLIGTLRHTESEPPAWGEMQSGLVGWLEACALAVPSLANRRDQILPLAACLLRNLRQAAGLGGLRLGDSGLAFLWRQSWSGNLKQLEALLMRAAKPPSGGSLDAPQLQRLARSMGESPCKRLSSRAPRLADLQAALCQTRFGNGRINKTRAAMYLGWDPDTLVRRMDEAALLERGS